VPQPKLALWLRPLLFLLSLLPGLALLMLTTGYLLLYLYVWFTNSARLPAVFLLGLVISLLWLLYIELPPLMRHAVHRGMRRRNK
jgi:hypothetical protein